MKWHSQTSSGIREILVLVCIVAALPTSILAQPNLVRTGVQSFNLFRPDASFTASSVISASGPGFTQAFQVKTLKKPTNPWDIQLNSPTLAAVAKDDVIAGELWIRRAPSAAGDAVTDVVFEKAGEPYTQSLVKQVTESAGEWTRVRFAFKSVDAYVAGGAQVNLRLGYAVQTIEIGPFALTNFAKAQQLGFFPNDVMTASQIAGAGGANLVSELPSFTLQPPAAYASYANRAVVGVTGQSFTQAVQVQTLKVTPNPWDIQLSISTLKPVAKDDVVAGEVWIRRIASPDNSAGTGVIFQQNGDPYTTSFSRYVSDSSGEWTRFRFAFKALESYGAGGALVNLTLGSAVQTIQIGGLKMTNQLQALPVSAFPNDIGSGANLVSELPAFSLQLPDASYANRAVVGVTGQSFTQAVQVQTLKVTPNPWDIQLSISTLKPVAKDDVVAGEVWIRRIASPDYSAGTGVIFQQNGDPYTTSFSRYVSDSSGEWTRFRFAFKSLESYGAGGALVNLTLGLAVQTIQIGGLRMTNQLQALPVSAFPNDITYDGRSPTARWRAEAAARIEQFRKANLTLEVRDPSGQPVAGAPVTVRMKRHAFGFGSAVAADLLLQSGSNADQYRHIITNWFNRVVLENDLKWDQWEANRARALNAVTWLRARNIEVRGHNLIWPGTRWLPGDVTALLGNPSSLRSRINSHFSDILGSLRGKCADWDVLNEPISEHAVQDVLGKMEMVEWFKLARSLDPAAKLFVNDFQNVDTTLNDTHATAFYDLCKFLVDNRAPLDGIGFQCHVGSYLNPPTQMLAVMDKFAGLGASLAITELDVDAADETLQADYLRDFMTTAFSHPKIAEIVLWGFWAGRHWIPNAALFRNDWSIKANGLAWSNLVLRTWWTDTNTVTDAQGRAVIRGFKGDYEIEIPSINGPQIFNSSLMENSSFTASVPVISLSTRVTGQIVIFKNSSTAEIPLQAQWLQNIAGELELSATSDNLDLLPSAAFAFSGTGLNRSLTINPAAGQIGSATITITAKTTSNLTASTQFALRVRDLPVSEPPSARVLAEGDPAEPNQSGKFVVLLAPGALIQDGVATPVPITAPILVRYAVTGSATAGVDFLSLAGTITVHPLADGSARGEILVSPIDDLSVEGSETIALTLLVDAAYVLSLTATASLTIADDDRPPAKPVIIVPPQKQTASAGTPVTFTVQASGGLPLAYRWFFEGVALIEGLKYSGVATTVFTIQNISAEDQGDYTVEVSNAQGAVSAIASLAILPLPAPRLNWNVSAGVLEFTWVSAATDFRIEYTPLTSPPVWETVPASVTPVANGWRTTISPHEGIYRLAR